MNLYDLLGIKNTASQDEIKKAYRKLSTKHHPDKGGDAEKFKELVMAYNILFDEGKRKRYDLGETAENITKSTVSEDQETIQALLNLFNQVIVSPVDLDHMDIFDFMKKQIVQSKGSLNHSIRQEEAIISKFQRAIKRIKTDESVNIFEASANQVIKSRQEAIKNYQKIIRIGDGMIKLMEAYSYDIVLNPTFSQITYTFGGIK